MKKSLPNSLDRVPRPRQTYHPYPATHNHPTQRPNGFRPTDLPVSHDQTKPDTRVYRPTHNPNLQPGPNDSSFHNTSRPVLLILLDDDTVLRVAPRVRSRQPLERRRAVQLDRHDLAPVRIAHQAHVHTTCTAHAHSVHTTCTRRASHVHTPCTHRAHPVHTTCIPCAHPCTPRAHPCTPRAPHVHSTCTPRAPHVHSTCTPRAHPCTPRAHLCTPVHTPSTNCDPVTAPCWSPFTTNVSNATANGSL